MDPQPESENTSFMQEGGAGGIGACKGSPPKNFVAELRSLEEAELEVQRDGEIRKKLEKNGRPNRWGGVGTFFDHVTVY